MTVLSRRGFAVVGLGALLVGCGSSGEGVRVSQDDGSPGKVQAAGDGRSGGTSGGAGASGASGASGGAGASGTGGTTGMTPSGSSRAGGRAGLVPVALKVPSIGVDTPLLSLGLASDGTVAVPPVVAHDRAGWYRYSPSPGQTGPSVILGHVTVGEYGDGVFRHLSELSRGDEVVARLADGREPVFRVTAVRTVAKSAFPTREVYGDTARPELRLITCGGTRTGEGYADNVIVFAELKRG
ncbi:class F sortase [Streptomyces niveiscabiei]|uniref:class F sortase n=1 Tax=Streptomyces TaxID=1883 RepID=UPI0010582123|nr:class F sortase [Streptomyces sp. V2]